MVRFVKLGMGGPAAWLGVGDRPFVSWPPWSFRLGVLSDARSSLICAGWLPQDGLFDWNGHHCLQKANVASRGWLFIGFAWIPFLARGSGFNLPARTFVDDLVREAAPANRWAVRCAAAGRAGR